MKSTFIDMVNGKAIVKLEKARRVEWLACIGFDDTKPEGSKWSSASYFDSLLDAVEYAKEKEQLYLVGLAPDCACGENKYAVVKGRKAALEFVKRNKEFLSDKDITAELKELENTDQVHFGDYWGAVYMVKYELGNDFSC